MYKRPFRVLVRDRERKKDLTRESLYELIHERQVSLVYGYIPRGRPSRYRTHAFEPANSLGPHDWLAGCRSPAAFLLAFFFHWLLDYSLFLAFDLPTHQYGSLRSSFFLCFSLAICSWNSTDLSCKKEKKNNKIKFRTRYARNHL